MREDIKQRIEKIDAGQSPSGYKTHHRVGVLPSDWDMKPLGEVSVQLTEKAGDQELETLSISAGVGFVNQAQKFGKELSGKQYVNYTVLRRGDFSYNKGNSKTYPQGCIYRLEEREIAAVPNVFNSFRLLDSICNSDFYVHLFINGFMNHQLYRLINAGVRNDGLLNLYSDDFYGCLLPIPPLTEQHKIAEILNHCDKVIDLKQQLIEEERKRKKWLQQKLFAPKDVLCKPLGDLCIIIMGQSPDSKSYNIQKEGVPLIQGNADIIDRSPSPRNYTSAPTKMCMKGDIILSVRAPVGMVSRTDISACLGRGVCAIRAKEYRDYLYQFLLFFENKWGQISQGSTFDAVSRNEIVKIMVPIVDDIEETANLLMSVDTKISLLESELIQWQQKKKALMQLLLTGIVRVSV